MGHSYMAQLHRDALRSTCPAAACAQHIGGLLSQPGWLSGWRLLLIPQASVKCAFGEGPPAPLHGRDGGIVHFTWPGAGKIQLGISGGNI